MNRPLLCLLCVLLASGACVARHRQASLGGLEARVVAAQRAREVGVATALYRGGLSRSLYSRCQMFPSDSQAFDLRAASCGPLSSSVLAISRLLLEEEATPSVLPNVFAEGRLRWLDIPPAHRCAP